jgi:hypothetical protein
MTSNLRTCVAAVGLLALSAVTAVVASQPTRIRGTIQHVDGDVIEVKQRDGAAMKVRLAGDTSVSWVAKSSISDIKPGSFIGTTATPQADGNLMALEVHIFPESLRGTGEGTRDWDLAPGSSMTNGTVQSGKIAGSEVSQVEGNTIKVDYKGGSKAVVITPATKIVTLNPGVRSDIKPGVVVFISSAMPQPDGSLSANRVTLGKDGVNPPM